MTTEAHTSFWTRISKWHTSFGDIDTFVTRAAATHSISSEYENICRQALDDHFAVIRGRYMFYSRVGTQTPAMERLNQALREFPLVSLEGAGGRAAKRDTPTRCEGFWQFIQMWNAAQDGDLENFIGKAAQIFNITPAYEQTCRVQLDKDFATYRGRYSEYARLGTGQTPSQIQQGASKAFPRISPQTGGGATAQACPPTAKLKRNA